MHDIGLFTACSVLSWEVHPSFAFSMVQCALLVVESWHNVLLLQRS